MQTFQGLKRGWRQRMAKWKNDRINGEWGGILLDYNPQTDELNEIHRWQNEVEQEQAFAFTDQLFDSGRDQIYVAVSKTAQSCGYFLVHTSNREFTEHHFWPGVYEPEEAFYDMKQSCREFAKKMGFSGPRINDETV